MTVAEFLQISDVITEDSLDNLQQTKKPVKLAGEATPENLDGITFGQLVRLQEIRGFSDLLFTPPAVLLELKKEQVMSADFEDVVGFSNWVGKEVARIGELFAKTNVPPTPEQERAGISRLKFGMFGILDYYALRMRITDHEAVEEVPWVRIYKCLDMDAQRARFERRLKKVLEGKR